MSAAAVRIALWLNASAICDRAGCHWPMNSTDAAPRNHPYLSDSLYYGPAGVALFLQQLASTQAPGGKDNTWRDLAGRALDASRSAVPSALESFGPNAGFYYGLLGIAYGLRAGSDGLAPSLDAAAAQIEAHVLETVLPLSANASAVLWNNTDVAHGAAGSGLYLLWLSRRKMLSPTARRAALEAAVRAGEWLLSRAEPAAPPSDGLRWARGPDTDGDHLHAYYPTFCCGSSGVAYFLSELSQARVSPSEAAVLGAALRSRLLDAAERGAAHLLSLAVEEPPSSGGMLLPHEEECVHRHAGMHTHACLHVHACIRVLLPLDEE